MARNEEKQLARLNRFYLQKDKEAQKKKNPPRPKLETLQTTTEIQKWLPSIKRDLDFYIKQSEVTCYTQSKIDQFSRKINALKWEYRAFVQKLRELNPGLKVTPWTDRPYAGQKRKAEPSHTENSSVHPDSEQTTEKDVMPGSPPVCTENDSTSKSVSLCDSQTVDTSNSSYLIAVSSEANVINAYMFTPLSTPVLANDKSYSDMYGYSNPAPVILNTSKELEDLPLEFSGFVNKRTDGNSDEVSLELSSSVNKTTDGNSDEVSLEFSSSVNKTRDRNSDEVSLESSSSDNKITGGNSDILISNLVKKTGEENGLLECTEEPQKRLDITGKSDNLVKKSDTDIFKKTKLKQLSQEDQKSRTYQHSSVKSILNTNQKTHHDATTAAGTPVSVTNPNSLVSDRENLSLITESTNLIDSSSFIVPYSDSESETDT